MTRSNGTRSHQTNLPASEAIDRRADGTDSRHLSRYERAGERSAQPNYDDQQSYMPAQSDQFHQDTYADDRHRQASDYAPQQHPDLGDYDPAGYQQPQSASSSGHAFHYPDDNYVPEQASAGGYQREGQHPASDPYDAGRPDEQSYGEQAYQASDFVPAPNSGVNPSHAATPAEQPQAHAPQFTQYQPTLHGSELRHAPEVPRAHEVNDPRHSLSGFNDHHGSNDYANTGLRGSNFDQTSAPGADPLAAPGRYEHREYSPSNPSRIDQAHNSSSRVDYVPNTLNQARPGHTAAAGWDLASPDQLAPSGNPANPGMPLRHDGAYDPGQMLAQDAALAPHEQAYDDVDDEDYDGQEPGGLGFKLILTGVLVASIMGGGGLVYSYKSIFGDAADGNRAAPIIKASASPAKVQPRNPGGRKFPHADSRLMEKMGSRLPSGALRAAGGRASVQASTQPKEENDNRVKVVTTMTFDKNGRMVVSKATPPSKQAILGRTPANVGSVRSKSDAASPLPGTTIATGDGFGPPTAAGAPASPPRPRVVSETRAPGVVSGTRAPSVVSTARTSRPIRTARGTKLALPTRKAANVSVRRIARANVRPVTRQGPINTQKPVVAVSPRRTTPQRVASRGQTPPSRGTSPAPNPTIQTQAGGRGYVAVLSTKRSRISALQSYADIQQRYTTVLGTRTPDVQQADLRSRGLGMMYRVVVGPPGSRQAALKVCSGLKAAGYRGCWVKAY